MPSALCIALVFGAIVQPLSPRVTLTWMHSVERTAWEEDYMVEGGMLHLQKARVKTSGAGMDPPSGALWSDEWWHYRPALRMAEVILANSQFAAGYTLCWEGTACRPMDSFVPKGEPVKLAAAPCAGTSPFR